MSDEITQIARDGTPLRTLKARETCRHTLTTDQLLEAGRQLAETQNEVGQLEDDFKSVRDDWKARISAAEARVTTLSGRISRGYDMKDTECTVYMDTPDVGLKTCLRDDTGERVWVRDMTESDKQLVLQLDEENAEEPATSKGATENVVQVIAENVKELAEKSGIPPETLIRALTAINAGASTVAKLQREMKIGYTAAAKLFAVAQEAGAPAPEKETSTQEKTEGEY